MTAALLLGSLGALAWGGAGLATRPSSRALGASRSVLWLGVVGVLCGSVLALLGGGLPSVRGAEVPALIGAAVFLLVATQVWAVLAGRGTMSLAAPIVACDGAVAALAAVATGQALPALAYLGLSCMVGGLVVLSAGGGGPAVPPDRALSRRATIGLAVLAAFGYGGMLFCAGTVESTTPLWTVTIARAGATLGALAICLGQGRLRPNRHGLRWAATAGVLDLTAFSLFVAGAQHHLAIAAVAASQYGAVAALAGVVLLGERLTGRQTTGVAVLVFGAGVVAATGG